MINPYKLIINKKLVNDIRSVTIFMTFTSSFFWYVKFFTYSIKFFHYLQNFFYPITVLLTVRPHHLDKMYPKNPFWGDSTVNSIVDSLLFS